MSPRRFSPTILLLTLLLTLPLACPALATDPSWLEQTRQEAKADGYRLATREEIKTLAASKSPHVVLDVRADYEFQAGHIPDAADLSLLPGVRAFALDDVPATFVLVEFYKELCLGCLNEISAYNEFHRLAQADDRLRDEFRMFGIGVSESKAAVAAFRKSKSVAFPLFSDEHGDIFDCLGTPPLPSAYLLRRLPDGRREIIMVQSGSMASPQALLRKIKSSVAQATRR